MLRYGRFFLCQIFLIHYGTAWRFFLSALFFFTEWTLRSIREKSLLGSKLNFLMKLLIMHWAFTTASRCLFIIRGLPGTDSGIYTDMLLNILIVLHLFSSAGPATIALLLIVAGKLFLGDALFANLIYAFFNYRFSSLYAWKSLNFDLVPFKKSFLVKLSAIPLMLFYLHQKYIYCIP